MKTRILVLLSMVALMMVMLAMAVASAFAHTLTGSGEHSMTPKGIHHCIHKHMS
jgi:hypothetical protein